MIIEAAERAASGIIEDAESQARDYLEESRRHADRIAEQRMRAMSELTDSLLRQAEAAKRQSDELIEALDRARRQIESPDRQGPAPMPESPLGGRVSHLQPVEPEPPNLQAVPPSTPTEGFSAAEPPGVAPEPPPAESPPHDQPTAEPQPAGPAPVPPRAPPSDGARLLATQMAVGGSSRSEIENRLRNEFGIEDATAILDGILGPE